MEDRRNILADEAPFGYKMLKDGKIQIFFRGELIKTLHGRDSVKFQRTLDLDDEYRLQLFMAKITGHFKHGNERGK